MAAVLAAAAAMLTANTFFGPIFYTNRTASAPRGIYLAVPGQVSYGDYAIVASPGIDTGYPYTARRFAGKKSGCLSRRYL